MKLIFRCLILALSSGLGASLVGQVKANTASPVPASPVPASVQGPNCGIKSVLNLAQYLGELPDVKQTIALCDAYSQTEISMFDVQQAAKQIGISLEGVDLLP